MLARRLLLDLRAAFRWALSRGEITANPAAAFLDGLRHIERKPKSKKLPALVTFKELLAWCWTTLRPRTCTARCVMR